MRITEDLCRLCWKSRDKWGCIACWALGCEVMGSGFARAMSLAVGGDG